MSIQFCRKLCAGPFGRRRNKVLAEIDKPSSGSYISEMPRPWPDWRHPQSYLWSPYGFTDQLWRFLPSGARTAVQYPAQRYATASTSREADTTSIQTAET